MVDRLFILQLSATGSLKVQKHVDSGNYLYCFRSDNTLLKLDYESRTTGGSFTVTILRILHASFFGIKDPETCSCIHETQAHFVVWNKSSYYSTMVCLLNYTKQSRQ